MSNLSPISSAFAADLVQVLLHFLWQGMLIAGLVWLVLRICNRARPLARYLIVLLGGLLCALAPVATLIHLRSFPGADVTVQRVGAEVNAVAVSAVVTTMPDDVMQLDSDLTLWQIVVLAGWLLGVLLMTARLLLGWLAVHRLRKQAAAATAELVEQARTYASQLGLRRMPRIALSARIPEAMVVGLLRPIVLLPTAWLTELPPDVLSAVLSHELAHVRRLDPWVNTAQRIVETVYFYHPAVWWLSRRLRLEREFCCDELAVRITGQPLVYARTLELVAHSRARGRIPALASGIGDRKMTLLKRVQHVLGGSREDRPRSLLTPLAAALLVLCAFAAWRSPLFTPQSLLADDEVRRGRAGERARRGDRDEGARNERRRERRSESRRTEHHDDDKEHESDRDPGEVDLPEGLPEEVRELIGGLLSEIEKLRDRLGEEDGEVRVLVEVEDIDEDGDADLRLEPRRVRMLRIERPDPEQERDGDQSTRSIIVEMDEGERRVRALREGQFEWRVGEPERHGSDDDDGEVGEEHEDHEAESYQRRYLYGFRADDGETGDPRVIYRLHQEFLHPDHRDEAGAEHDDEPGGEDGPDERRTRFWRLRSEDGELPGQAWRYELHAREPERRPGLEAEVKELREQVRDLAEVVSDLRSALRERDEVEEVQQQLRSLRDLERRAREEAEEARHRAEEALRESQLRQQHENEEARRQRDVDRRLIREVERQRLRNDGEAQDRRPRDEELERHRERDEEAAGAGEADEESARIEPDGPRRLTLQSTGDGRVRVYVREPDGDVAELEANVIELSEDGRLNVRSIIGLDRIAEEPADDTREDALDKPAPFDDDSPEDVDPFGEGEADAGSDPFAEDETDSANDPFAGDETEAAETPFDGEESEANDDPFESDETGQESESADPEEPHDSDDPFSDNR